ncbi:MAG: hypothetical protein K1X89_18615 [Myxococcaceae bacterium]|nr:hypothetical protein [Myxococcaceae bacterium]
MSTQRKSQPKVKSAILAKAKAAALPPRASVAAKAPGDVKAKLVVALAKLHPMD